MSWREATLIIGAFFVTTDIASAQAPNAPTAQLAFHSDRRIDVAACALSCFDLVFAHATPPYFSMDAPQSVTLIYNSRTAYPRPFVLVDAHASASGTLPDKISIAMKVNGVSVQPLDGASPIYYAYSDPTRPAARLKFQFDASGYSSGRYPIEIEVRAWNGGASSPATIINSHILVVNQINGNFGAGWNVAGIQNLTVSGNNAIIAEGDGSAVHFQRSCGGCAWVAPDGDFTTLTFSSPTWTRTYPDGSRVLFDSNGLMTSRRDRNAILNQYQWTLLSGVWYVTEIRGPEPANKATTLAYTSGQVDITDPGGRVTRITHSGGGLDRITFLPDSSFEDFQYHTGMFDRLMSHSTSQTGHVTQYGYSLARQHQFTYFPAVAIADSASPKSPVFHVQSLASIADPMLAWGYGTSSNPAPLSLAAHGAYVVDARGNRSNIATDRFGALTLFATWLGSVWGHHTTQIERNQNSQPTRIITPRGENTEYFWTSSKLDSVRNNHSGRRVRFQYTGTFNDVSRIWGDIAETHYFWSVQGRLDSTRVGPHSTVSPRTRYTYDTYGRVTQTQDRQANGAHFVYGAANSWQNVDTIRIGPRTIAFTYDSLGRQTSVS